MAFSDDLKASREALGLSVLEASKKVGVAYNTFRRYEDGETVPSPEKQEEMILKLESSEADSDISSLINELAQKQISEMKKNADENRLLLPLLRKMGWEVISEDGIYQFKHYLLGKTKVMTYDELLDYLSQIKEEINSKLIGKLIDDNLPF